MMENTLIVRDFTYEVNAWDSWRRSIRLNSDKNIRELLNRLEKGENLFEVIPGLSKKSLDKFGLRYALFEQRNEDGSYQQVGKLLVPYDKVLSRSDLKENIDNRYTSSSDKERYEKTLLEHPKINSFYHNGNFKLKPLNSAEIFVLKENQII